MEPREDPDDELSVRLQWPADDMDPGDAVRFEPPQAEPPEEQAETPAEADPEPVEWATSTPTPAPAPAAADVVMPPGEVAHGVEDALGAITARLDSLTSVTTTFRNMISDRMGRYEAQFGRLADSIAGDLDDERQWLEQALGILHHGVSETVDAIRRIATTVDELATEVAGFQEETSAAIAVLTDEVQGLRRRTTVRSKAGGGLEPAQLRAVTDAVTEAVTESVRS